MTLPFTTGPRWPPAHFEALKRHHFAGLSASQVAWQINAEFRSAYTRNAVIGVIHRHLPVGERVQRPSAPKLRAPPVPRAIRQNAGIAFGTRTFTAERTPAPTTPAAALGPTARPWLARNFGECAYIVSGEGADAISCCAPARQSNDWCYCPAHAKRIFAAPSTNAQRTAAAKAREAKARAMKARAA